MWLSDSSIPLKRATTRDRPLQGVVKLYVQWAVLIVCFSITKPLVLLFKCPIKLDILKCNGISTSIIHSASTIFTPLLSQSSLNILPILAFHFLYITCLRYLGANTICFSIWNVINFLCHSLTKPPAPIFWFPDRFYYSARGFFLILKYFYLPPVELGGFVIPIRCRTKKPFSV